MQVDHFFARTLLAAAGLIPLASAVLTQQASKPTPDAQNTIDPFAKALPIITKYCLPCHTGTSAPAGLRLGAYKDSASLLKDRATWDKVADKLKNNLMPPPSAAQPSAAERQLLFDTIQSIFAKAPPPPIDPGRPTLRRLNRAEYDNTVRDLFGIEIKLSDDFPSDDVGYGFDNIGDVLSLSPLLMEKYLDAAEKIAAEVIKLPDLKTRIFDAANLETDTGRVANENAVVLFTNGRVWTEPTLEKTGLYKVRVIAFAQQAGPEPAKMSLRVDGVEKELFEVRALPGQPATYEIPPIELTPGKHRFAAAFTNDYYKPDDPDPHNRDRNLFIVSIEVTGPLGALGPFPAPHRRLMIATPNPKDPLPAARTILKQFLKKAFRRPVSNEEVERHVQLVDLALKEGQPFEQGIRLAVQAALVSPHFLFRVELDSPPRLVSAQPEQGEGGRGVRVTANPKSQIQNPKSRSLTPHELASRLSYFLWSSMPDDELFRLAENRELLKPQILLQQVARMLRDQKANALTKNFAAQWLTLRKLDNVSPDPELFPDWSEELRKSMRTETEIFFESVVKEDRSVLDFLTAKDSFVNQTLAKHYGLAWTAKAEGRRSKVEAEESQLDTIVSDISENPKSKIQNPNLLAIRPSTFILRPFGIDLRPSTFVLQTGFRHVILPGPRAGIFTQASILTLTSNPNRTSPVKRGKWILENILGAPPPPPPPGLDNLEGDKDKVPTKTIKERMAAHRSKPECAICHARMDPIGFSLENFNPLGKWRVKDGPFPVDPSETLPDGTPLSGPASLSQFLLKRKDDFVRALSEKLLTYALGRGLTASDKPALDKIAQACKAQGYKFSALIQAVVSSDPFLKRSVAK